MGQLGDIAVALGLPREAKQGQVFTAARAIAKDLKNFQDGLIPPVRTAVLIYENRKSGPMVWDISTPGKRERAYLSLFEYLDTEWQVYSDLQEPLEEQRSEGPLFRPSGNYWRAVNMRQLYAAAGLGDSKAAESLLKARQEYEYESWQECRVH